MANSQTESQVKSATGHRAKAPTSSDALLAAVPDMMFRFDRDGRYLQFKPAKNLEPFAPPEEFLGSTMHDILPKNVAEEGLVVIQEALDTGEDQVYSYDLLEEAGLQRYEARIVPLSKNEVLAIIRHMGPAHDKAKANERYALTKRELSVLEAVAGGHTDKEVARRLSISPLTVRKHVASIRKKMGAQSRTEASVRALKDGLLPEG